MNTFIPLSKFLEALMLIVEKHCILMVLLSEAWDF